MSFSLGFPIYPEGYKFSSLTMILIYVCKYLKTVQYISLCYFYRNTQVYGSKDPENERIIKSYACTSQLSLYCRNQFFSPSSIFQSLHKLLIS